MLNIIEGANYVGKTTTLDILKKNKSILTFYHPRFNDSQYFDFDYKTVAMGNVVDYHTSLHRDVVYQISHMTCLKYLTSVKDKKVLLDRCFLSEMVYNELYDRKIYHEFVKVLKTFQYTIFLLIVKDDDVLRNRITERLKKDETKTYGIRDKKGFVPEPDTIDEKMKSQRMIENKYSNFIHEFGLTSLYIDTSHKSKQEVAKIIKDAL